MDCQISEQPTTFLWSRWTARSVSSRRLSCGVDGPPDQSAADDFLGVDGPPDRSAADDFFGVDGSPDRSAADDFLGVD